MSFLAPLFLVGAAAIAGPILFHLWRRTPRGKQVFSTLMFLVPSPPRMTNRSRLEHLPLLLLRGLLLLLLVLAFSRPFFRTEDWDRIAEQPLPRVAILVDRSASMRREGVWDRAREEILDRMSASPSGTRFGIFAFADDWSSLANFDECRDLSAGAVRDLAASRLEEMSPTWQGTGLGLGVARTIAALQEEETRDVAHRPQELWVVSDLAEGADTSGLENIEWPAGLRVVVVATEAKSPGNAGLQPVADVTEAAADVVRVRVQNASDSTVEEFTVDWEDVATDDPVRVVVPAGQSRVVAIPRSEAAEGGTVLRLTGDSEPFDNLAWVPRVERPRRLVAYLGEEAADDPQGLRFYLEGALSVSSLFDVRFAGPNDPLDSQRPSLIVIPSGATVPDWVTESIKRGSVGLIVLTQADGAADMLARLGLTGVEVAEAPEQDQRWGEIDFESPWLAPFAEARYSDFTGIRFWKHRSVKLPEGWSGMILTRFENRDPAWFVQPVGMGRLHVMTSGWQPTDSQLARSSKFPPLMMRLLEDAAGISAGGRQKNVGDRLWDPPPQPVPEAITMPQDSLVKLPEGDDAATTRVLADVPGIYQLTMDGEPRLVAVNVPLDETRTSPMDLERLVTLGVPIGEATSTASRAREAERLTQARREDLEREQKVWWWLILAAACCLLLEAAYAHWLTRRRREAEAAT
jgi:hypothetical protein